MMTSRGEAQDGRVLLPPAPVQIVHVASYSVVFCFFVAVAVNDVVAVVVDIVSAGRTLVDGKSALERFHRPPLLRYRTQMKAVAAAVVPIVSHEFVAMWLATNPDLYRFFWTLHEFENSSVLPTMIVQ